jgi:hypothetical protein
MIRCAALALALLATPAAAVQTDTARAGLLRVLDKITGAIADLELRSGEVAEFGVMTLRLDECRYPSANPNGDAFALVEVWDSRLTDPVFQGWMVASAPALNAMDHPRYDIWVLSCVTE